MPSPYEYFSVAADVLALRRTGTRYEILLIQRKNPPFRGSWALPGGFLERDEDARTAAQREFAEEAGIHVPSKALFEFGSFSAPHRDPRGRVVTISFYTLLPWHRSTPVSGDDAKDARWFSARRLPKLAFDHREMIRQGFRAFKAASAH